MASTNIPSPSKRGRPANITVEKIVACALDIGLGDVSMHKVAKALGVSATALYRHVENKEALIALCTDLVSQRVELPQTSNWEAYLYALARAYRTAALSLPGSVEFLRYVGFHTPHALKVFDHALGVLREAGFAPDAAFMATAGVVSHATDMVLHQELAERKAADMANIDLSLLEQTPNVIWSMQSGVGFDHEQNFEVGLQIIIEGIRTVNNRKD